MTPSDPPLSLLVDQLMQRYDDIREPALRHRLISQSDLIPLIRRLEEVDHFKVEPAGSSVEGRPIYRITIGNGPMPVLMWSQMHGDEPTATMALFDLFRCLTLRGSVFDDLSRLLLQNLTLHIIPMINPDGAERYQRRNALQLDLNRDAPALQSPEARLLMDQAKILRPRFGFNLHDQLRYYTAGESRLPAALTFLAPPVDGNDSIPDNRRDAMLVIAGLYNYLKTRLPGRIGSYKNEFEPRAFGERFQQMGISTILIESGGYEDDPEKQILRRWNLAAFLYALASIARGSFRTETPDDYSRLEEVRCRYFDLIIRNATLVQDEHTVRADIAVNRQERLEPGRRRFRYEAAIEDIGDLSNFHGYVECNADGLLVNPGRIYVPEESIDALPSAKELLEKGYTDIYLNHEAESVGENWIPLNVIGSGGEITESPLAPGSPANLRFTDGANTPFLVINGQIVDPESVGK